MKDCSRNWGDGEEGATCILPKKILASILGRLPPDSVLRLRKLFTYLLTDRPSYIHSKKNPKFESHILDLGALGLLRDNEVAKLDFSKVSSEIFLTSWEGVVCIARPLFKGKIVLWNPASKLWKTCSESYLTCDENVKVACLGFGRNPDPVHKKDFRAVRILSVSTGKKKRKTLVEVYSSTSDCWTSIKGLHAFRVQESAEITVKGNRYWFGSTDKFKKVIVSFDMANMKIKLTGLPKKAKSNDWRLVSLNDQLGVMWSEFNNDVSAIDWIHVWIFDDQHDMWIKKLRVFGIVGLQIKRCLEWNWMEGVIIIESQNGEVFAFDSHSGSEKKLQVSVEKKFRFRVFPHKETLARAKGMKKKGLSEEKKISQQCFTDGFFSSLMIEGSLKFEVYYGLNF